MPRSTCPGSWTKKAVAQIVDYVFTEMGDYFIGAKSDGRQRVKLTYPGVRYFHEAARPGRGWCRTFTTAPLSRFRQFTVTFLPGSS